MKSVMEYFVSIIVILLGAFLATLPITTAVQKENATQFHSAAVAEIEDSGLDPQVIKNCIDKAKANKYGYQLTVTATDGSGQTFDAGNTDTWGTCYRIELKYNIEMPMIGVSKNATVVGYAR